MTHDEYINLTRSRAVELAQRLLTEDKDLVKGCRKMNALLKELQAGEHEGSQLPPLPGEFVIFTVVDSEGDRLPIGVDPSLLDRDTREGTQREEMSLGDFYRDSIREGCEEVLRRYGDA